MAIQELGAKLTEAEREKILAASKPEDRALLEVLGDNNSYFNRFTADWKYASDAVSYLREIYHNITAHERNLKQLDEGGASQSELRDFFLVQNPLDNLQKIKELARSRGQSEEAAIRESFACLTCRVNCQEPGNLEILRVLSRELDQPLGNLLLQKLDRLAERLDGGNVVLEQMIGDKNNEDYLSFSRALAETGLGLGPEARARLEKFYATEVLTADRDTRREWLYNLILLQGEPEGKSMMEVILGGAADPAEVVSDISNTIRLLQMTRTIRGYAMRRGEKFFSDAEIKPGDLTGVNSALEREIVTAISFALSTSSHSESLLGHFWLHLGGIRDIISGDFRHQLFSTLSVTPQPDAFTQRLHLIQVITPERINRA